MTNCATIGGVRASGAASTLRGVLATARTRPIAAGAAAALVLCALWLVTGAAAPAPQAAGALIAVESPVPLLEALPDERGDVRRGRCASCGFVVGIRELQPGGFEFTVRLRDGSIRISNAASRGSWHIGDAVMLMGGAAVAGQ